MKRKGCLALVLLYLATCVACGALRPGPHFPPNTTVQALPASFLMGTATAAHQVEGGNTHSDWAHFRVQAGRASDHWNRVTEDVRLMKGLGADAYRFSLEWSRLEPRPGEWDEAAWAHYQDELRQLRHAGITPMVTLLHFTLPDWLQGGLLARDFPDRFGQFAAQARKRLGGDVELWCTLNEPNVLMLASYVQGDWPPNEKDPAHAVAALAQLARAHAHAARELKGTHVGVALNLCVLEPHNRWSLVDQGAARLADQAYNWAFADALQTGRLKLTVPGWPSLDETIPDLRNSVDWFGLNYYTRFEIKGWERVTPRGTLTDMGWAIYPEGLLVMLRAAWQRYRLPIYVTENGLADERGDRRAAFVQSHLWAVHEALREGIDVRGYFHWSLLDNFEWAEGFRPRFGLYRVDYATYRRTPAPGSEVFSAWARARVKPPPR